MALLLGILAASRHGITKLGIGLDSDLLVKHLTGQAHVYDCTLKPLVSSILEALDGMEWQAWHVYRRYNKRADFLANHALSQQATWCSVSEVGSISEGDNVRPGIDAMEGAGARSSTVTAVADGPDVISFGGNGRTPTADSAPGAADADVGFGDQTMTIPFPDNYNDLLDPLSRLDPRVRWWLPRSGAAVNNTENEVHRVYKELRAKKRAYIAPSIALRAAIPHDLRKSIDWSLFWNAIKSPACTAAARDTAWKAFHAGLYTADRLKHIDASVQTQCVACKNSKETQSHLLTCDVRQRV